MGARYRRGMMKKCCVNYRKAIVEIDVSYSKAMGQIGARYRIAMMKFCVSYSKDIVENWSWLQQSHGANGG